MFATKKCPENDIIYFFEKLLIMSIQNCKKFCQILDNLMCS